MGDVYEAMRRARQKADASAKGSSDGAAATPAREAGSLPIDQIASQVPDGAQDGDAAAGCDAPGAAPPTVPDAHTANPTGAAGAPRPQPVHQGGDKSLNGYSPVVVAHHDRGSTITEQYRAIRTQILARARNRRTQVHTVTSSIPAEGKTVTSVNLGVAFSELRDKRILIIEGDLRKPAFEAIFDRECPTGLTDYLTGGTDDIGEILHATVYDNFQFIPAGRGNPDKSTELLASPRMAQLIDRLRDLYDHIFIDSPPVINVTDPCILGALSDQVILVVRLNRTPVDVIERTKRLLKASNCEVGGVVLTHQTERTAGYSYRYEGYYKSRRG